MDALKRLVDSKWFNGLVFGVIVLNGVLVGWQTSTTRRGSRCC